MTHNRQYDMFNSLHDHSSWSIYQSHRRQRKTTSEPSCSCVGTLLGRVVLSSSPPHTALCSSRSNSHARLFIILSLFLTFEIPHSTSTQSSSSLGVRQIHVDGAKKLVAWWRVAFRGVLVEWVLCWSPVASIPQHALCFRFFCTQPNPITWLCLSYVPAFSRSCWIAGSGFDLFVGIINKNR